MNNESLTLDTELKCILKYAAFKTILVEVGVCWGGTSKKLRHVMASTGTLFLVDPFYSTNVMTWNQKTIKCDYDIAKDNVDSITNGNVVWLKMESKDAAQTFKNNFSQHQIDFIFIDGDHSENSVRIDWNSWKDLIALNGVVLFHDVSNPHPGVMNVYYNEVVKDPRFEEIETSGSVKVIRRIK